MTTGLKVYITIIWSGGLASGTALLSDLQAVFIFWNTVEMHITLGGFGLRGGWGNGMHKFKNDVWDSYGIIKT